MLAREGLHTGDWQWALLKSTPRAASRSMFGVFACGCPPMQPIQSLRSSMAMSRTLGLAVSAALAAASPAKAAALRQARMRTSCRFFIYTESIRKTDYGLTQLKIADQVVICAAPALGHGSFKSLIKVMKPHQHEQLGLCHFVISGVSHLNDQFHQPDQCKFPLEKEFNKFT